MCLLKFPLVRDPNAHSESHGHQKNPLSNAIDHEPLQKNTLEHLNTGFRGYWLKEVKLTIQVHRAFGFSYQGGEHEVELGLLSSQDSSTYFPTSRGKELISCQERTKL